MSAPISISPLRSACLFLLLGLPAAGVAVLAQGQGAPRVEPRATSAILFNVDGAGAAHWTAARLALVGPDGRLNWDELPAMADYRNHIRGMLAGNSNSGATAHAFGVKVTLPSYGSEAGAPLTALSGKPLSLAQEAQAAGKAIGLINTGDLTEAATGTFYGRSQLPIDRALVAKQMIEGQPDLILAGGEVWFLPEGKTGRHGAAGLRKDGFDLLARAKELGYTIVFTREELLATPLTATRVLGIFAGHEMSNEASEEDLRAKGLPLLVPGAPSTAEMTTFALKFLARDADGFFLAMNEETADNAAGVNNASGVIEGLAQADATIGVLRAHIASHPESLVLVTADAPAGGMAVLGRIGNPSKIQRGQPLPPRDENGAPIDGQAGTGTAPFLAKPDRFGETLPYAIAWATLQDNAGGVLARAEGRNSDFVRGPFDNTDVYRVLYATLFGKRLP
jgi:alkaline phosphatase